MKYIKGLDALRALSISFVVLNHSRIHLSFPKVVTAIIPTGAFGVDVFFVLSGFLITSILLRAEKEEVPKIKLARNFIIRRTLRIFPVYYLTMLLLWLIGYPDVRQYFAWFLTYTSNILIFKNHSWGALPHTWSLSVEEQFYLLWPWLLLYVNRKYLKYLFAAFILCGPVSSFITMVIYHGFWPVLAPNCFDSFGIGGLYAYCSLTPGRTKKFKTILNIAFPLALGIYLYWKIAMIAGYTGIFDGVFNRTINSIIAIWLIDHIIRSKSGFWQNPALNSIGKVSYGIYIFHVPVAAIINSLHITGNLYIEYAIKLSVLLLISYGSYYFFELKVMALKKKFTYSGT
jgi:peptidoglycan/LPS O-acetylase OafA/YrhL